MIPDYLAVVLALAALAYSINSIIDTWLMVKEIQK
jgi:hypothetical protein